MGRPKKYATDAEKQAAYRARLAVQPVLLNSVVSLDASLPSSVVLSDIEKELVEYMLGTICDECEMHYDLVREMFKRVGLLPV